MIRIDPDTTADLFFQINWSSDAVRHTDAFAGHRVNFWRDIMPDRLYQELMGKQSGDLVKLSFAASELVGGNGPGDTKEIDRNRFNGEGIAATASKPRLGRFYPKGVLADMAGIFKANREPFRCVHVTDAHIGIFMGHPLEGREIKLGVTLGSIHSKLEERGGSMQDWGETITHGVGMQARWENRPTDFFTNHPFERKDESPDPIFYEKARLVNHIDYAADDVLNQIYARFTLGKMKILDLMSSWKSHLPDGRDSWHITGIGLNREEMVKNDKLDDVVVQDLNRQTRLPFDEHAFDMVMCSLSVEYLTSPEQIFSEVARVIKPGGHFIISFSNRWFEPKVIRIWTDLHEFERMGLVLEYFKKNGNFDDLHTYSVRGLLRPSNDKYAAELPHSDPIYAVWGRKK